MEYFGAGGGGGGASLQVTGQNKDVVSFWPGAAVASHSSGVGFVLASAADDTKPAVGLAVVGVAVGAAETVLMLGPLTLADWTSATGGASLAAKTLYFLSPTTPGALTTTPPTTAGQILQAIGYPSAPQVLDVSPDPSFITL